MHWLRPGACRLRGLTRKPAQKRKAAKREPRQKPFPLLSLPPELRNRIYQEALGGPDGIYICNTRRGFRRSCAGSTDARSFTPPTTNLLATSQAVYAEAAAVMYGQRLRFEDNRVLLTFLSLLRPATAARLRDVAVADWNSGRTFSCMNVPAMALLSHASAGLRRLHVETELLRARYYGYWGSHPRAQPLYVLLARKVFRDCYPLLYAIQAQRGLAAVLDVVGLADVNFCGGAVGSGSGPGKRYWGDPDDMKTCSVADLVISRRRSYQKELGKLLGCDAAEVEAVWKSASA